MPIERMLRASCCGDSSNAKYRQRSPRSQAAWTKRGGHAGLAGPGRARDEDGAAAEIAAAQHGVEPRYAARHPLGGRLVLQPQRGDGQDREAGVVDQERILVRAVRGAAVLHDPQPARGDLLRDPVVEQDHAVRDVFLEPVPGERSRPALGRDDGGHAAVLQPAEQPAQLGAQQGRVRQAREQALDRVEHDALGADRVDGVAQADEQPLEVVLARLLDLGALDAHVVDQQLLLGATRRSRSKPSDATFWASSSAVSSKAMNTPGSPISMPRTRNSTEKRVLPAPALPQTRVGRPRGRPPPVISSRPRMPLRALGNVERTTDFPASPGFRCLRPTGIALLS